MNATEVVPGMTVVRTHWGLDRVHKGKTYTVDTLINSVCMTLKGIQGIFNIEYFQPVITGVLTMQEPWFIPAKTQAEFEAVNNWLEKHVGMSLIFSKIPDGCVGLTNFARGKVYQHIMWTESSSISPEVDYFTPLFKTVVSGMIPPIKRDAVKDQLIKDTENQIRELQIKLDQLQNSN